MNAEFDYLPAAQSVTAPAMPTIKWHIDCVSSCIMGAIPNQEPYGGTDDIHLAKEEGVDYELPDAPLPPPHKRS